MEATVWPSGDSLWLQATSNTPNSIDSLKNMATLRMMVQAASISQPRASPFR